MSFSDQCYVLVIKLVSSEDALRATDPSPEAKIRGVYLPAVVALIAAMGVDFDWMIAGRAVTDGKIHKCHELRDRGDAALKWASLPFSRKN